MGITDRCLRIVMMDLMQVRMACFVRLAPHWRNSHNLADESECGCGVVDTFPRIRFRPPDWSKGADVCDMGGSPWSAPTASANPDVCRMKVPLYVAIRSNMEECVSGFKYIVLFIAT
jgi:hypothetical protein